MAIILYATCWNILPEGEVPKLGHKMNIKDHINIIWEDAMLETNVSLSLDSAVLCSAVLEQSAVFFDQTPYETTGLCYGIMLY